MSELERIEPATHEEIIAGDFVRLASGSPLGLVRAVGAKWADVTWFASEPIRRRIPWLCLRQERG
jgi:hypothetical protein